jgi:hypothetical protein
MNLSPERSWPRQSARDRGIDRRQGYMGQKMLDTKKFSNLDNFGYSPRQFVFSRRGEIAHEHRHQAG